MHHQRFHAIDAIALCSLLAIGAGMLLPALRVARADARQNQCTDNLRDIGQAVFAFENATRELPRTFYNLYGIERAGRLSGLRFFGAHDWYREGCDWLVKHQVPAEAWYVANSNLTVAETRRLARVGQALDDLLDHVG